MVRRALVALALTFVLFGMWSFAGCTAILGDFEVGDGSDGGHEVGIACQAASDCASGSCSDGVCCESACDGVCEKCNLPGTVGKCMPVPDGEDPENECPTTPLPDAGPDEAGVVVEDAGDAGDAATDAEVEGGAVADAGPTFALPDGGVEAQQNQCAGKCNGKRACHYPSTERTCGTVFCGNATQQGRASCDGQGHCLFGVEECQAYSCPNGSPGCKASCTGESDCLPSHFCDAQSSTCKPKLSNGSACLSVAQCQSGYCVSNVCCNDSCNGFPGASCTDPGSVGQCKCTACAGGGTCRLYYRDADGDGFGDKYGTVENGNAEPGCVAGPAPSGFVANNDDCLDALPNGPKVHPGQTAWFNQPYTHPVTLLPSFDYDCNDAIDKETPEFLGGKGCGFCKSNGLVLCSLEDTCSTAGQAAGLGCGFRLCPINTPCSRCATDTRPGFTTTVDCGVTRARVDCGSCTAANGNATGNTSTQVQQRCH